MVRGAPAAVVAVRGRPQSRAQCPDVAGTLAGRAEEGGGADSLLQVGAEFGECQVLFSMVSHVPILEIRNYLTGLLTITNSPREVRPR